MKTSQILVASSLFVLVIVSGQSPEDTLFSCYTCNSFTDPDNCVSITDQTPLLPCAVNETLCRKVEQHINYNGADHIRVFRQCATRGTPGDCESRTGTYRFKSWYCHCKGSRCNGAESLVSPLVLTVTLLAAGLSLRRFL